MERRIGKQGANRLTGLAAICLVLFFLLCGVPLGCSAASSAGEVPAANGDGLVWEHCSQEGEGIESASPSPSPGEPSEFPWGTVFVVSSVVSLILAVLLAVRAGNKKYGKDNR